MLKIYMQFVIQYFYKYFVKHTKCDCYKKYFFINKAIINSYGVTFFYTEKNCIGKVNSFIYTKRHKTEVQSDFTNMNNYY